MKTSRYYKTSNMGWLRIGRILIDWRHKRLNPSFSERFGYVKYYTFFNYRFRIQWCSKDTI